MNRCVCVKINKTVDGRCFGWHTRHACANSGLVCALADLKTVTMNSIQDAIDKLTFIEIFKFITNIILRLPNGYLLITSVYIHFIGLYLKFSNCNFHRTSASLSPI